MIQTRIAPPPRTPGGERRFPAAARTSVVPSPRPAPVAPRHPFPQAPPPVGFAPAAPFPYPRPVAAPPRLPLGPRLVWVGLAWLLFGVLVLVGVAMVVTAPGGGPDQLFAGGETATVQLDAADSPMIFVALDGAESVTCWAVGPAADQLVIATNEAAQRVVVDGREWHAAFHLTPAAAGAYQLLCEGAGASFGVGGTVASFDGAATSLVVLPLVGLAIAVTTTAVVMTRRRRAQDRLFAPWTGAAAPRW